MVIILYIFHVRKGINQQIEDFGVPYHVEELPEPDVLLHGGEAFTFGDTTVTYVFIGIASSIVV